jgi:hypothetical protein
LEPSSLDTRPSKRSASFTRGRRRHRGPDDFWRRGGGGMRERTHEHRNTGRFAEAEQRFRLAVRCQELAGESDARMLASTWFYLTELSGLGGCKRDALPLLGRARGSGSERSGVISGDGGHAVGHGGGLQGDEAALCSRTLGTACPRCAERQFQKALKLREGEEGDEAIGAVLFNLALIRWQQGDLADARYLRATAAEMGKNTEARHHHYPAAGFFGGARKNRPTPRLSGVCLPSFLHTWP